MSGRYLNLSPLSEALAMMRQAFPAPDLAEAVSLRMAVGRVTAEPLYAVYSVPAADIALFDGYAVRSRDTQDARDQRPVPLSNCCRVNTGETIPPSFDAVVMIEDTWLEGGIPLVRKPLAPWQHIRHAGEDVRAKELVLPKGHQIRPFDVGALATYGITRVKVRSVRVGIIPTGSDLVPQGEQPVPGQSIETNTLMAEAYLGLMGATCRRYRIVPDDPDRIRDAVCEAVSENDFIIVSAGSSAGTRDFSAEVIGSLGEVIFHGIAVRPGKPVIMGRVNGKPVLGMPGYPVAAQTMLREFAGRLLEWWGLSPHPIEELPVKVARKLTSDLGFDEFVPVSVGRVNSTYWATPHPRGGGIQMAVVRSNGYLHLPAEREGIESGEEVKVTITVPKRIVDHTLICIGVRDPSLNELGNCLGETGYRLHSCSATTMGAVLGIHAGTCHTGSICIPEIDSALGDMVFRYLPGTDLLRVRIARIEDAIVSSEGLGIRDLDAVRFVNQPRGTASRMLLDAHFARHGIDPGLIAGYDSGVKSHDAVVAAIRNGFADAGVCSATVAKAAGLQCIPIGYESLELLIRKEMMEDKGVERLIHAAGSEEFRVRLRSTGRYCTDATGQVLECNRSVSGDCIGTSGSASLS